MATHNQIFAEKGYTPALGYYKAYMNGLNTADQAAIKPGNLKTTVPTLQFNSLGDPLLPFYAANVAGLLAFNPKAVIKNVSVGHVSLNSDLVIS